MKRRTFFAMIAACFVPVKRKPKVFFRFNLSKADEERILADAKQRIRFTFNGREISYNEALSLAA